MGRGAVEEAERDPRVQRVDDRALPFHEQQLPAPPRTFDHESLGRSCEEIGHHGVNELIVVGSMHERKQLMFERSDAFAVLPGGIGTIEETFEIITWKQLLLHDKPIVIVNIAGYWQKLQALVDHVIEKGFASRRARALFQVVDTVDMLMEALATAREPVLEPEARLI